MYLPTLLYERVDMKVFNDAQTRILVITNGSPYIIVFYVLEVSGHTFTLLLE